MSKTIAVVNQKGGVAKTTTTNALGIGLARKGSRVLLVDLDPQGNLSMSLGVPFPDEEENTIAYRMLRRLQDAELEPIGGYLHTIHGVDFFVGNDDLGQIDRMLPGFRDGEYTLDAILEAPREQYDYILIDCMPSVGSLTENAIVTADEVIIPSEPQFFSTKGIQSLLTELGKIKKRKNPGLQFAGILPTKVDLRTNNAREFLSTLEQVFGSQVPIYETRIPVSTKLAECNDGKNLYEYDSSGKGVLAYAAFVEEYLRRAEGKHGEQV